jgi:hypothetical protein
MSAKWPAGALAAAVTAAAEAFKLALIKLQDFAQNRSRLDAYTEPVRPGLELHLAPEDTPTISDLGDVDFISAGAINNAALYCLSRFPAVRGVGRVIEHDDNGITNLNRNATQRRSQIDRPKAETVIEDLPKALKLVPVKLRYDRETMGQIGELAATTVVGVDDIPTRWLVQSANPAWLVIGGTTHWSAMASHHQAGLPCAGCLHPRDEEMRDPIPTVAFVSFWAGLLVATRLLWHRSRRPIPARAQQIWISPFRPEPNEVYLAPVQARGDCPVLQAMANHVSPKKPQEVAIEAPTAAPHSPAIGEKSP